MFTTKTIEDRIKEIEVLRKQIAYYNILVRERDIQKEEFQKLNEITFNLCLQLIYLYGAQGNKFEIERQKGRVEITDKITNVMSIYSLRLGDYIIEAPDFEKAAYFMGAQKYINCPYALAALKTAAEEETKLFGSPKHEVFTIRRKKQVLAHININGTIYAPNQQYYDIPSFVKTLLKQ